MPKIFRTHWTRRSKGARTPVDIEYMYCIISLHCFAFLHTFKDCLWILLPKQTSWKALSRLWIRFFFSSKPLDSVYLFSLSDRVESTAELKFSFCLRFQTKDNVFNIQPLSLRLFFCSIKMSWVSVLLLAVPFIQPISYYELECRIVFNWLEEKEWK